MAKGNRKFLRIPDEEFFEQVLFLCGPPHTEQFAYYHNTLNRGIGAWCRHDPQGQHYVELLVANGEAKKRATRMYLRYAKWYQTLGKEGK